MDINNEKVGFQGEIGSYSEEAVHKFFVNAVSKPYKNLSDLFLSLENGEIEYAIVPVENSIQGSITETYDLLLRSSVRVSGEINIKINHCLIAHSGIIKNDINLVYSHPQALGQCRNYLRGYGRETIATYDTAGSVKMIKEKKLKNAAAIASRETAKLYDMAIIDEQIQDNEDNFTRFFCLSNKKTESTGNDKTSIIFSSGHVSGALYKALREFAEREINLCKIESRPTRKKAWEYNFYLDFEGHIDDEICNTAIEGLKNISSTVKILGSYPKAKDKLE